MSEAESRHNVKFDKPTATLSRSLAWKLKVSQSRFIEESVCWLANYLRKSPASTNDIRGLAKFVESDTSTLTVRLSSRGESELGFLTKSVGCSANGVMRAAVKVCANFVEHQKVDALQEQILESNLQRYLSDLRRAGFRIIDVSYPLIDDVRAEDVFYLLCREPFALVKGSTLLSIIAMPVGNEVSLWKTDDNGTRRIDLMLTDVIGDSTDFSHLNDSHMVEKLREKLQAMGKLHGWNIIPQYGPRQRRLTQRGVKMVPVSPNVMSYLYGDMREVIFNLGAYTLNAIRTAATNVGGTVRNQPTFGLISDPIENPNVTDQPHNPAAVLICLDPNRRILLGKMTKDDQHAFAEGGALVRGIVEVLDRFTAPHK